jgi:simple sugar transport system ATP-binding protein
MLEGVTVPGHGSRPCLQEVSLTVHEGEIVCIAGVSGNGQAALAALLAGTGPPRRGRATMAGSPLASSPPGVIRAGIGRIPEDRHREGVVGSLTIAENLVIEELDSPAIRRFGFLRRARIRARARTAIEAYDVRCPGPDVPIHLLSGGNMQKVILARVLERAPRLILANQPTRGLDIGATTAVHGRLLEARARGAGIVLISEDLDELLGLSDRIGAMVSGRLSDPEPVESLTLERLGLLISGSGAERAA